MQNINLEDINLKVDISTIAIDYEERFILVMTPNAKLVLFSLRSLLKLCTYNICNLEIENPILKFGKRGNIVFLLTKQELLQFKIGGDNQIQLIQRCQKFLFGNFCPDSYHKNVVFVNDRINITQVKMIKGDLNLQIIDHGISSKIPIDLIQYSDDDCQQMEIEQTQEQDFMIQVQRLSSKINQFLIIVEPKKIMTIMTESQGDRITTKSIYKISNDFQNCLKETNICFDEQELLLSIVGANKLSIFQLNLNQDLSINQLYNKQVNVEKSLGFFYFLPYHVKSDTQKWQFLFTNYTKGSTQMNLLTQNEIHEYATLNFQLKSIHPIKIWDQNCLLLDEGGILRKAKFYKTSQWEHLDYNFAYVQKNFYYVEKEGEFDYKSQPIQHELQGNMFDNIYSQKFK